MGGSSGAYAGARPMGTQRPMNPYGNDVGRPVRPPQGMQSSTPDQGLLQVSVSMGPKGINGKRKRGGRKGMLPTDAKSGGMIAKPMPAKSKKPGNPMGAIMGVTKSTPSPEREPGVRKRIMKEEDK